ncbi:MAG: YheU family protein [Zetaproteobacteria bacterium]|nr:YheU family protein [Zetaproteobacteria bacterium]
MESSPTKFTVIPTDRIEPLTLDAVIEEFVCREGTDYGQRPISLEDKKSQVYSQLKNGSAVLVFEISTKSTTVIPKEELLKLS